VFQSAEGLEAGKAKINYGGVDIGVLSTIRLAEDHQRVIATAQMTPRTEDFLVEDTRLWVVRPRISGANEVADIRAQIDLKTFEFSVPVTIRLDPQRLGVKVIEGTSGADLERMRRKLIDAMVAHGVRAQLRTGNLLTGSAFVALDFFPGAPQATVDWSQAPVQLPTIPGQLHFVELVDDTRDLGLHHLQDDRRSRHDRRHCESDAGDRGRHAGERARHARQYHQRHRGEFRASPTTG
jgi:paraquat-inducible protein B